MSPPGGVFWAHSLPPLRSGRECAQKGQSSSFRCPNYVLHSNRVSDFCPNTNVQCTMYKVKSSRARCAGGLAAPAGAGFGRGWRQRAYDPSSPRLRRGLREMPPLVQPTPPFGDVTVDCRARGDAPRVFTRGSLQGSTPHARGAWESKR